MANVKSTNSCGWFDQDYRAITPESVKVSTQTLVFCFHFHLQQRTVYHEIPQYRCWKKWPLLVVLIIVTETRRKRSPGDHAKFQERTTTMMEKKRRVTLVPTRYCTVHGPEEGSRVDYFKNSVDQCVLSSHQDVIKKKKGTLDLGRKTSFSGLLEKQRKILFIYAFILQNKLMRSLMT